MANTWYLLLLGGPCDGTTKKVTQATYLSHHTTCSGQTYIFESVDPRQAFHATFRYQADASTGSAGSSAVAPKTHGGWNDLRALSKNVVPPTLRQSKNATTAALRALSKLPKVRL